MSETKHSVEFTQEQFDEIMSTVKPLGYLAGSIMSKGDELARMLEYEKFEKAGIPGKVYSPIMNKSINDKSNMTEEQNNTLAEKITDADIERLWNSDYVVISPEQHAIGTMCELGCLYGWHYMATELKKIIAKYTVMLDETGEDVEGNNKIYHLMMIELIKEILRIESKAIYAHYYDIRTNHLNEKDWRRSFSINQLLYGMILACTSDHMLHNSFDEILPTLQEKYGVRENAAV